MKASLVGDCATAHSGLLGWLRHRLLPAFAGMAFSLAACAEPASVSVSHVASMLRVEASAFLRSDVQTVWDTLVAYERLPDFIPDLAASRVLDRSGNDVVVAQSGLAGIGPFRQRFSLTLAAHEVPLQSVTAQAVAGDFSRFESSYRLSVAGDGRIRLDYAALIEPKAGIPLLGVPLMQWALRRQFEALVDEIARRAAARTAADSQNAAANSSR